MRQHGHVAGVGGAVVGHAGSSGAKAHSQGVEKSPDDLWAELSSATRLNYFVFQRLMRSDQQ